MLFGKFPEKKEREQPLTFCLRYQNQNSLSPQKVDPFEDPRNAGGLGGEMEGIKEMIVDAATRPLPLAVAGVLVLLTALLL